MTVSAELELLSFVLLRLGDRRFAVAAGQIAELVAPTRVFRFPHRTPKIEGVIQRRGRIIPVCDVAEELIGKNIMNVEVGIRRFYDSPTIPLVLLGGLRLTGQPAGVPSTNKASV